MSLTQRDMLDIPEVLRVVGANIAAIRVERGLPPLICPATMRSAPILLGQEQTARAHVPPRITFVPKHVELAPARTVGMQPETGKVSQLPARPFGGSGTSNPSCRSPRNVPVAR